MSERTAKIEIENKAHNLEQEKDFRLTNTKRLYWMLILIILLLIGFIIAMTALGLKVVSNYFASIAKQAIDQMGLYVF
jgi:cell division protein FtsL